MARHGRSFPIQPHLPKLLPLPFLAPPATIVGQGAAERLRRRRYSYSVATAPPIVAPIGGYPVARGTFVRPLTRPQKVRQAPTSTTLPPSPPFLAFVPPRPYLVSTDSTQILRRRRFHLSTILPPPVVAPTGGYPVASGTFVGQGAAERIRRRRYIPTTLVAPPIVAQPALAPPATIVSDAHIISRRGRRGVPLSTILPIVTFFAPVARYGNFISLGAAERQRRRRGPPSSTIVPPAIVGRQPVTVGTFVYQTQRRPYIGRSTPRPHLALPIAPATFVAPLGVVINQAVQRALTRRSLPFSTRVPKLGASKPVPTGTFVSQAIGRSYTRRIGAPKPHLATPIVAAPVPFRAAGFLSYQAVPRALIGRGGRVLLPRPPGLGPVPAGTFRYQATQRALTRRTIPVAHLAKPVPAMGFIAPPATVITAQAMRRALIGRSGRVRLPALGATQPVLRGTFVSQAIQRPLTGRKASRTSVARPLVAAAIPFRSAGFLSLQAIQRTQERRYRDVPPNPHLAPPVATPAGPGATVKLQSLARQLRRRDGRVLLSKLGSTQPVALGTFVTQALRRPYVRRTTPEPHLAPPIVPLPVAFLAPAPKIVSQAAGRAVLRRSGSVRLPSLGSVQPVPRGTFVSQSLRRPYVGRSPLRPRVAPPVVAVVPFLAPPALVVVQATQRGWQSRFRTVPKPHLAPPVPFPAGPGATIRLQAVTGRALLGRGGRVRLPSLGARPPVPRGTFVDQAIQRPLRGRTVPAPHLALGIVTPQTFPPNAPGTFIEQAVERSASLVSRRGHVRLAPPVLSKGRIPPTLVVSQAQQRPYIGRKVIPPHLAPPVRTQAGPGAHLYYQAVQRVLSRRTISLHPKYARPLVKPPAAPLNAFPIVYYQAISRMYIGRKVPPSPSLRYHPIVFAPSQPFVPFPSITKTGITRHDRTTGISAPREVLGATGLQLGEFTLNETTVLSGSFGMLRPSGVGRTKPPPNVTTTQPNSRTARTAPHLIISRGGLQLGEFILSETSILGGGL